MQGASKGVPCKINLNAHSKLIHSYKNIFKISTFRLYKLVFLCKINLSTER